MRLVDSLAAALCSVAVSEQGTRALSAATGVAEGLLDALAAAVASPMPLPQTLESLCWSLQRVGKALRTAAAAVEGANPRAREGVATLVERGVPLLRQLLASPEVASGLDSDAQRVSARARALLEGLEGS